MPFDNRSVGDLVLRHLAELGAGRCIINDQTVAQEENPEVREILAGLLLLHEDLQLERARKEEAIKARDEFISVASHELRTPLTAIRLQMELLGQTASTLSASFGSELRARLEVLRRQQKRLESLVNELLDVSRITSGRLDLLPEEIDLRELVWGVIERFEPEIHRQGVEIAVYAPLSVVGLWDPHRLDQVVTNLLTNALRYGKGQPVEIQLARSSTQASFSVTDYGLGISAEDQARIFLPFERARSAQRDGGMGLGLWIVRRILEAMGGEIRVLSRLQQGSTFSVTLPLRSSGG